MDVLKVLFSETRFCTFKTIYVPSPMSDEIHKVPGSNLTSSLNNNIVLTLRCIFTNQDIIKFFQSTVYSRLSGLMVGRGGTDNPIYNDLFLKYNILYISKADNYFNMFNADFY